MKFISVSALVIAVGLIGMTSADEFTPPPMKDGLWEVHSTQVQQGKTVQDMTMKMCQSKELTNSMKGQGDEARKKDECTSKVSKSGSDTYVEESHCAKGLNAGSATKMIYTYHGDTAYHMEMHLTGKDMQVVTTMDGKYLSSCPTGMKPGDAIMPDGKKIGD